MSVIPFAFLSPFSSGVVSGADGDLVILNGQTVDVVEGSVKQYNSITINTGGTLRITGSTGAWTEIGCKGNAVINGTIIARAGYDGQVTHGGGTFSKTSAFNLGTLSYSITQANGGNGGSAANAGTFLGGAGGISFYDASRTLSGSGGGGGATNGLGQMVQGENGGGYLWDGQLYTPTSGSGGLGNGSTNDRTNGGFGAWGGGRGPKDGQDSNRYFSGGGGSGYKGHHGKGVVLYVEGNLSGTGSLIVSGRNGFNGGASVAFADQDKELFAGISAGGGAGAGGSGGRLVVRYKTGTVPSYSVTGGSGGVGGSGANAGNNGSAGSAGTVSVSTI